MKDGKKIVATIEARMTSTRLPGKVLLPLEGEPVLSRLVDRLKKSRYIDEIVMATTTNPHDDVIVELAKQKVIKCWRGSEDNVLERVLQAAQSVDADLIVEITGDDPLIDWRHIDHLIDMFTTGSFDYVANNLERTFPRGFDVQVFPVAVLNEVYTLTKDPVDLENVSIYIYNHPEKYRLGNWKAMGFMRRPDIRVTLDTPADYEFINTIFQKLLPDNPDFSAEDVVHLLERKPALLEINRDIKQKSPYGGVLEL